MAPGFSGGFHLLKGATMTSKTRSEFSPEIRERAVRMVDEHRADYSSEWVAMTSIAGKFGCTAETLRRWCRKEANRRLEPAAQTASEKDRLSLLEREVKELRRENEILRNASAYFAQAEFDRQSKL
jgi:transposase